MKRALRGFVLSATGAAVLVLTAAPVAGASTASSPPVTVTTSSPVTVGVGVPVSNLLPGQADARAFELTNATSSPLPAVALTITPTGASPLFAAGGVTTGVSTCSSAWQASATAPGGFTCPNGGTQTTPVPLTAPTTVPVATNLAPGASTWVAAWFTLPLTAGNQFESATGSVNLTLVSTELPPAPASATPPSTPVAPPAKPPTTAPVGAITTDEGLWIPPPTHPVPADSGIWVPHLPMWWGLLPLAVLGGAVVAQRRRGALIPVPVRSRRQSKEV